MKRSEVRVAGEFSYLSDEEHLRRSAAEAAAAGARQPRPQQRTWPLRKRLFAFPKPLCPGPADPAWPHREEIDEKSSRGRKERAHRLPGSRSRQERRGRDSLGSWGTLAELGPSGAQTSQLQLQRRPAPRTLSCDQRPAPRPPRPAPGPADPSRHSLPRRAAHSPARSPGQPRLQRDAWRPTRGEERGTQLARPLPPVHRAAGSPARLRQRREPRGGRPPRRS
ncbi:hypothetical protein P7K49_031084 [Saguinus oedipus]|uniref:Uncharacterized protein n=1 Tax=Saguinus oedipus TaxID=9490 RepID=A0ABQ9U4T9_SAGOE|nr:hypothetical protein P7K49_031084 [Saguinus oedipus]